MSVFRRIMLGGIDINAIPETNKIYYTATAKISPKGANPLGSRILLNKYNPNSGEGVIATQQPITTIGNDAFSSDADLAAIVLPSTIKEVQNNAFAYTSNLKDLTLSTGNIKFGDEAFFQTGVTTVNISSYKGYNGPLDMMCSNSYVGRHANPIYSSKAYLKYDRQVVTSGTIIRDIEEYALAGITGLEYFSFGFTGQPITIGKGAFYESPSIFQCHCSSGLNVKNFAFYNSGLKVVSSELYEVGESAFSQCPNLWKQQSGIVVKSETVQDDAFSGSNINILTLSDNVKQIDTYAFYISATDSPNPTTIQKLIHNSGEFLGAFKKTVIGELQCNYQLPLKDTTRAGFAECIINDIIFGDDISNIVHNMFRSCRFTQDVLEIPQSVTAIGKRAFQYAHANKIIIPNSVSTIGENAFEYSVVDYISVGSGITDIPQSGFSSIYGIKVLDFSANLSVPSVTNNSITLSKYATIIVPDSLYDEWISASYWKDEADRTIKKSEWDAKPRKENGAYIQHVSGWLYTATEWQDNGFAETEANGIAVIDDDAKFVISKVGFDIERWGRNYDGIPGATIIADRKQLLDDTRGVFNTQFIDAVVETGAAKTCINYTFPDGKIGYLPAIGEWIVAYRYKEDIENLISIVNGDAILPDTRWPMWSSTRKQSDDAWYFEWEDGDIYSTATGNEGYSRPFATLTIL